MHFHSRDSDGSSCVEDLIAEAKKRELTHAFITDHDFINQDFVRRARENHIQTWYSTEISVKNEYTGISMHLTFYTQNYSDEIHHVLENTRNQKKILIAQQIKKFNEYGFDINPTSFYQYCIHRGRDLSTLNKYDLCDYIYHFPGLKDKIPSINDGVLVGIEDFYQTFLKKQWSKFWKFAATIDEYEPTLSKVWQFTASSWGILSVAHPNVTYKKWTEEFLYGLPALIREAGVNAIEINSKASKEWIEVILQAQEQYGLFLTFGSDCHHLGKPDKKHGDFWERNPLITPEHQQVEVERYLEKIVKSE